MTPPRRDVAVVAFLAFISALLAFGIDIILPAFDEVREEFDLADGSGEVSLLITLYFFGMAGGQIIYGPFADRFGRQPVLTVGLTVYAVGAFAATVAGDFSVVLAARFVWGLGAASSAVLYTAMARDLYEGDRMARVMQLVMAVFLLGPMVAPAIGELLLLTGWWRAVFAIGLVLAVIGIAWTRAFGETLPDDRRRPLEFGETAAAFRAVFQHTAARGYMLAIAFSNGAFFVYLGSGQPIIDEIYGYGDWFALIFGAMSLAIGAALVLASRLTARIGAVEVARRASLGIVASGVVFTALAVVTDGTPSFWAWLVVATLGLALMTVITPTCLSLALEPMARMAGTATAVIGLVSQGGGALLAAIVDRQIDDTITPMAIGFLVYGSIAASFVAAAQRTSAPLSEVPSRHER